MHDATTPARTPARSPSEARRRALRAARAVTLTMFATGFAACAASVDMGPPPDAVVADAAPAPVEDAAAAGDAAPEAAPDAPARDAVADAGCAAHEIGSEAWARCCGEQEWDITRDRACTAWGPFMPPSMEG